MPPCAREALRRFLATCKTLHPTSSSSPSNSAVNFGIPPRKRPGESIACRCHHKRSCIYVEVSRGISQNQLVHEEKLHAYITECDKWSESEHTRQRRAIRNNKQTDDEQRGHEPYCRVKAGRGRGAYLSFIGNARRNYGDSSETPPPGRFCAPRAN